MYIYLKYIFHKFTLHCNIELSYYTNSRQLDFLKW